MSGRWELSFDGFTIYELSDEARPVNLWSAQVQRDSRRFTEGQAEGVARLMRAAKEMADILERVDGLLELTSSRMQHHARLRVELLADVKAVLRRLR